MIVSGKWQGNMCSHLHYQARKHSSLGVFLHYHCSSIPRTVHLSMSSLLVGPWDGSQEPEKGDAAPGTGLPCGFALLWAAHLRPRASHSLQLGAVLFPPKGGQPSVQTYLQLRSYFWQGFARAVSKEWAGWQWDLASNGTLPNPWKILHGKNRV